MTDHANTYPDLVNVEDWLDYNTETGWFIWKVKPPRGRVIAGQRAGCLRKNDGYRTIKYKGKCIQEHNLAYYFIHGRWPEFGVDHVNGVRDDNRADNLRPATQSQNNGNTKLRENTISGLKGVSLFNGGRYWRARGGINGKQVVIGYYDCPAAAHFAYQVWADQNFGEFARIA
jgi:hypothetical protein